MNKSSMDEYLWDPDSPPSPDVQQLEAALARYRAPVSTFDFTFDRRRARRRMFRIGAAIAASMILLVVGQTFWVNRSDRPWTVRAYDVGRGIKGSSAESEVFVNGSAMRSNTVISAGTTVAVRAGASARLSVARLGDVYISKGAQLRVIDTNDGSVQLALDGGEMHARIWAPPRVFSVSTALGTAVDLGCVYTLRVVNDSVHELEVLYGAVELRGASRALPIPAGVGATLTSRGPGLPFPLGATREFIQAARAFRVGDDNTEVLRVLRRDADAQGTVTLWTLLQHSADAVPDSARRQIVARMLELVPAASSAEHNAITQLDEDALARYRVQMEPLWSSEPNSPWRRFLVRWRLVKPAAVLQHMDAER